MHRRGAVAERAGYTRQNVGGDDGAAGTKSSPTSSTNDDAKSTDGKTSSPKEDADESPTPGRKSRKLANTSTNSTTQTLATKTTIAQPSFLMIGYMYRPYTANTFSGRFTYYW